MHTLKWVLAVVVLATIVSSTAVAGMLTLAKGPTPIPNGSCVKSKDISVITPHYAISFAVETRPPWGIPYGSILDAAPVRNGQIMADTVGFVDFLPDGWNDWQSTRQEVTIDQVTDETATISVSRDFIGIDVKTTYRFDAQSPDIKVRSTITPRSRVPDREISSGYSLCTRQADVFGPEDDRGDWVAGFGPDWVVGLVYPGADSQIGGSSWRDLYVRHRLVADREKQFDATFTFLPSGDVASIYARQQESKAIPLGRLSGSTAPAQGAIPPGTVVLVESDGGPVAWTSVDGQGRFSAQLPFGSYQVRAGAPNRGWTGPVEVTIGETAVDKTLPALNSPGTLNLSISLDGKPCHARLRIEGEPGPIGYLHSPIRYTDPGESGKASLTLPPGKQVIHIDGGGFGTAPRKVVVTLSPGETVSRNVNLKRPLNLAEKGWYCADLHHHTNLADGLSTPEEVVLSQAASGLAFATVTDHDLVDNHRPLSTAATRFGMPVILGVEVSPPWGHFNLFPLPEGQGPNTPSMRTNPTEILLEAARLGALVQANHPWERRNSYFRSWLTGKVPGRIRPEVNFVEINADGGYGHDDETTLAQVRLAWNEGSQYVLTAGSDTHDVYATSPLEVSGSGQTCAYLKDRPLTPDSFFQALRAGRAIATMGPAVDVSPLPGSHVRAGAPLHVKASLYARSGISRVDFVADGKTIASRVFKQSGNVQTLAMPLPTTDANWIQMVVYDREGLPALVNPWWVDQ